ncbi:MULTISPECIES: PTS galactitol transporter subunit IIC [Tissierellales]|jgi:PTS system galactitol-specific IIC component|uniref:PTS sugar transporter subunit IIC n=1 Tax=Acidilutibacter cellobiosedens TaxID=2507161 RepID=A0A410QA02_9FIRM|nr:MULTISPECIES: PTS transporter subunit IIC [Tissierellales]MBE6081554.1 PTS sugar transporter subunit IIC [Tissierellaceae bacterium]QAT60810.1 PTS sugar transporter subunit IIC [Acidilutibacter cellobiosedens]SCL87768.1 PTS system galactitol-specific EIIC component [Sporanaerobacter sp. PP17-6a]
MSYILGFFNFIQGLGANVMMPIIIFIFGIILGTEKGKALRAGLTVGVGFIGLNLVINALGANLGPAVEQMIKRFGLSLSVIDVGWPAAAAIAFASTVGMIIIPVGLIVNIVMILTNTTQTVDVDIWDYWHFAFTGALVAISTGSQMMGVIAAVLNMIIIMVIGDYTAPGVEKTLGLPGVSLPHGFTGAYAPIAIVINKIIDLIPGVRDIDISMEKVQKRFGVFGEPILIGTSLGIIIGIIAGYGIKDVLTLGITMGAVLVLIPKMASLLMEGLLPISDAASEFINKRFSKKGKMYIGLDSAVGVGHPVTLSVSLILVPLTVFMAVLIPGNKVLPFADLAVIPWMFVLITPVVNGNGFRALINGIIVLAVGLLISTNLAPLITIAAQNANYTMPSGATQISSICDGANPLTWLIVRINDFGWIGMAVIAVVAISLAIINRKRILKEAHEMEQKA